MNPKPPLFLTFFFILIILLLPTPLAVNVTTRLSIVVSTPTLAPLVKSVAGDYVQVTSVVPFGTDPHEYQLVSKDLEKILNSDLLIVTGHFKWEEELVSLVNHAATLNLYEVFDGKLKLLNLPDGDINLHEWWLSPYNAKLVINKVASRLAEMDKYNANLYMGIAEKSAESIDKIIAEVNRMLSERGITGNVAICSTPIEQYLIEGFGIGCALILAEESFGIEPLKLENARTLLAENSSKVLVLADITEGTSGAHMAKKLADETSAYLLRLVMMPKDDWDYVALLAYNAGLISSIFLIPKNSPVTNSFMSVLVLILSIIIVLEAVLILKLRVKKP